MSEPPSVRISTKRLVPQRHCVPTKDVGVVGPVVAITSMKVAGMSFDLEDQLVFFFFCGFLWLCARAAGCISQVAMETIERGREVVDSGRLVDT